MNPAPRHSIGSVLAALRQENFNPLRACAPDEALAPPPGQRVRIREVDCKTPDMFRVDIQTGRVILDRRDDAMGDRPKGAPGETRAKVRQLIEETGIVDSAEVGRRIGISQPTASYHIGKLRNEGMELPEQTPGKKPALPELEPAPATEPTGNTCAGCAHEPVCRIAQQFTELENAAGVLASSAPSGLLLTYQIRCKHRMEAH